MQTKSTHGQAAYGGADPRLVPAYSIGDVAHHVGLPPSTVRSWVKNSSTFERVIIPADGVGSRLSFQNLVEVHVLGALRGYTVTLPKIREAIRWARVFLGTRHPLAELQLSTDRTAVFVNMFGEILNMNKGGQTEIGPLVDRYLKRIERDEARLLSRLFPISGDDRLDDMRIIAIDPVRRFGKPYLVGVGVETSVIASRVKAGESVSDVAEDFDATVEQVEGAVHFEETRKRAAA